jgi:hypothetical protein
MHELGERLSPGTYVVWLDEVYPMYAGVQLQPEAMIGSGDRPTIASAD